MTAQNQGKLEEFRALRDEMIFTMRERVWGTLTYVIWVGGISASFSKTHPSLCCLLMIYGAIPFLLHNMLRERSRIRIASYMRVFLENNETGIFYEKRIACHRGIYDDKYLKNPITSFFKLLPHLISIVGLHLLVALTSIIWLVIIYKNKANFNNFDLLKFGFGIVGFIAVIGFFIFYSKNIYMKKGKEVDQTWINAEEKKKGLF